MPKSGNGLLKRHTLSEMLASLDSRFIYICAPAGYGKTVAALHWLEQAENGGTILTLDEYDNAPARFCADFCAALLDCHPQNDGLRKIVTNPAFDKAPEEFTIRAIGALSADNEAIIPLVIDDLHLVTNEQSLRLLIVFLNRLPKSFQIMLISRDEMPPSFSELWLRGTLSRVTTEDLRFRREDVLRLYEKRGCPVGLEKADEITRFTDGWAIAISALLLSDGDLQGEIIERLDEFIRANIWHRWDEATRIFMIKTSVMDELTPPLCVSLTDERESAAILDWLVKHNVFISKDKRGVYKYHRLFRDFLQKQSEQRGEDFINKLLLKAGNFYLDAQDFHNAIDCFIKCENHEGIEKCYMLLVTKGTEYFAIEKMISIAGIPLLREVAEKSPYVYSHLAWTAYIKGNADDMAVYADLYYEKQPEIVRLKPQLALNVILLLLIDFRHPLSELIKVGGAVLAGAGDGANSMLSIINQNFPFLHRGTRDFSEFAVGNIDENVTKAKEALYGLFGERAPLLADCIVAGLLCEQGHLEKALNHALSANAAIKDSYSAELKFFTMSIAIVIFDALGKSDNADEMQKRMAEMIEKNDAYYLLYNFNAFAARRRIDQGDMKAAREWLAEHASLSGNDLDFYRMYGHLTTCRAYIAVGNYDAAIPTLIKALALAKAYLRPIDVIDAQILLSIAYWKKKRSFQNDAILYLEQAVSIAHKYGYTQQFINEGAELTGMLLRLQKRAEQQAAPPLSDINDSKQLEAAPASFVKMLCIKAPEHPHGGLTSGQPKKTPKFTDKQKEIMKLMCAGKSYREISETLGIALSTLRSHISAIYKKLDVTRETDAIKKIEVLKLSEGD